MVRFYYFKVKEVKDLKNFTLTFADVIKNIGKIYGPWELEFDGEFPENYDTVSDRVAIENELGELEQELFLTQAQSKILHSRMCG